MGLIAFTVLLYLRSITRANSLNRSFRKIVKKSREKKMRPNVTRVSFGSSKGYAFDGNFTRNPKTQIPKRHVSTLSLSTSSGTRKKPKSKEKCLGSELLNFTLNPNSKRKFIETEPVTFTLKTEKP